MPWGDREGGQLVYVTSPKPRGISPRSWYLEDPHEGSLVHMRKKRETVSHPCQGKNVFEN